MSEEDEIDLMIEAIVAQGKKVQKLGREITQLTRELETLLGSEEDDDGQD